MSNIIIPFRANLLQSLVCTSSLTNDFSILFDGIDDYVDCGDSNDFSFGNGTTDSPFSVSFWTKIEPTAATTTVFIGKDSGGSSREYAIGMFSGARKIRFFIKNQGGGSQQSIDSTTTLSNNIWYNVICTYNGVGGSNAADGMNIYVNAVKETLTSVIKGTYVAMSNTTAPLTIGKYGASPSQLLGNLDEVSIFNYALTQQNITNIYCSEKPTDLSLLATPPTNWYRNGDNGSWKSPQWLIPNNENKDKVSNYSFDFDGVDDLLDLGTISTLNNVSNFSISFRILIPTFSTFNWCFGGYTSASNNIYIGISGGVTRIYIDGSLSTTSNTIADKVLPGVNSTITIVYDGSLVGNLERVKIYVDGQDTLGTPTSSGTVPSTTSIGTVGYGFGGLTGTPGYVAGYSDDLLIFDYSLTYAQTLDIYNGGIPKDVGYLNPAHHWKMGDNATFSGGVWTVPDAVGSNNGTSNAMTIEDRIGEAPNSENNAVSFNMDEVDRVNDTP